MKEVKERFIHYKNNVYYVRRWDVINTETSELMVYYVDSKGKPYCRPKSMFLEDVELNGIYVKRFKKSPTKVEKIKNLLHRVKVYLFYV